MVDDMSGLFVEELIKSLYREGEIDERYLGYLALWL